MLDLLIESGARATAPRHHAAGGPVRRAAGAGCLLQGRPKRTRLSSFCNARSTSGRREIATISYADTDHTGGRLLVFDHLIESKRTKNRKRAFGLSA